MTLHETDVATALRAARAAAETWRNTPLRTRLRIIRRARHAVADQAEDFAALLAARRPEADTLVVELLPLLAAARFLERHAARILAPARPVGRKPVWLAGVSAEIRREPLGVVLILAPSNYPLFLPGVQILQALAAGNAVCAKPAPGCAEPLLRFARVLSQAGLPTDLLHILPDSVEAGIAASRAEFDCVVLTGSAGTGQRVLAAAAETLTPCIMELSGNDAVFVLPGADLDRVAQCLDYGLRLNHGATCIAPRRVFVPAAMARALEERLLRLLSSGSPPPDAALPPVAVRAHLRLLLQEAWDAGARLSAPPEQAGLRPILVADASPDLGLLREDIFAPVLSLVPVPDMETALAMAARCPYALGAAVFGPEMEARMLAGRVNAGAVVINDLIVPTADPRLPFGGRGRSGFGVTRGAEGLLALTVTKTISRRRGRFLPHLRPARPDDRLRHASLVTGLHGSPRTRLAALLRLIRLGA